ncbi:Oidioi.mRNA.OKI2018_I69.chr1.g705.t1.cds [Oikopleura dioica]|uniref:Oidioi.mRNA.OKI2018_I69.chr1.g705.t1.cds n=1 Tax=Oikopleura dioica TaxID=34765 RepID=A0ABN7SKP2_OIKDI|nr:Oidioi.mRNA.OKI2018_I69.chr1.g705.t1.cds [Oikopleura dioica]
MNTAKVTYFLKKTAKTLGWKIAPRAHGMRLGYVLNSSIGGIADDEIINSCRWRDDQMLRYYRNHHLEATKHGSAFKIYQQNEKLRLGDIEAKKAWCERSTQTPDWEPPKMVQTKLRTIKKMADGQTQTEEITSENQEETSIFEKFLRDSRH